MVSRISAGPPTSGAGPVSVSTFSTVLTAMRGVAVRPELVLEEVPAPTRLAPQAVALSGEVLPTRGADDDPVATGRFVLLHDETCPEPWEGPWRVVTYAKASMEPEVGQDPLAGEAGWSWLTDAWDARELGRTAEAGTVTCVTSESFGALSEREAGVELEIRASWSPLTGSGGAPDDAAIAGHLAAWGDLLCTIAGLPPLPDGVVALTGARR